MGCSEWFRKCPAGRPGGAEVGAAERGVSHGLESDLPAGAVLGVEPGFEVLGGVAVVPFCGLGDFRPGVIRADLGGTSGRSSLFSHIMDWDFERRCSGTTMVVSGIINFFKSFGEMGIR